MISEELCTELHERLVGEQQRLRQEIAHISGSGLSADSFQDNETDAVDQHPADDASELFEREKNLTVQRTLEASLQEVDDALRKFDEGTYGQCETCRRQIPEKRLIAMPEATHCIECQGKLERQAQVEAR